MLDKGAGILSLGFANNADERVTRVGWLLVVEPVDTTCTSLAQGSSPLVDALLMAILLVEVVLRLYMIDSIVCRC